MSLRQPHKRHRTPDRYWASKANYMVTQAVKSGLLPRLSIEYVYCVDCGSRALVYDHRDYARPLEVEPVCQSCNVKRGPAKCPTAMVFSFKQRITEHS